MFLRISVAAALLVAISMLVTPTFAADITAAPSERGAVVKIDGTLFTEYWTMSGSKPVLWPIIGPTGKPMTRAYPMGEAPDERKDHIHQRSLWFTHGSVNGVSFWEESPKAGKIVHRKFTAMQSGPQAVIATENDWVGPDGKRVLEDVRRLKFGRDAKRRWIDFDITLKASDGPVTFGDTKEGSFGVRVAESMKVDAKKNAPKLGGRIVNSEGQVDETAWGKRAAWVDYSGPVDDQKLGIAVLNHPSSFRFPTYWHVRTYGLFAANPFGIRDFTGGKGDGKHTLPEGDALQLRYRVVFHQGDEKDGGIAEVFAAYEKEE